MNQQLSLFIPPREGDFSRWYSESSDNNYTLNYLKELYFVIKGSPMGSVYIKEPTINHSDKIWSVCRFLVETPEKNNESFDNALDVIHSVFQFPSWIAWAKHKHQQTKQ